MRTRARRCVRAVGTAGLVLAAVVLAGALGGALGWWWVSITTPW